MASSLSSSSSLPFTDIFYEDRKKFDVFLSFRGKSTFWDDEQCERVKSLSSELQRAIEESKIVVVLSRNYATSAWCLVELVKIIECKKNLEGLPIFHHVDPSDVGNQTGASADAFAEHEERFPDSIEEAASTPGRGLNYGDPESQLIDEFIESLGNQMPQDGSTNWNLPPRYDVTPDESDDTDDDADEMVQDYVADLPLEAHVVPDDVAGVPQEAHVVEDHAANLPQACQICFTNARNMAFLCGHTTCVECGERLDTCHICREPISCRIRLFLGRPCPENCFNDSVE